MSGRGIADAVRRFVGSAGVSGRGGVVALGLAVFAVALLRTAWTCDDAYITFRVLDNAAHGHGLRWNVAERVQVFTHPLWALLLLPWVWLAGDPYAPALLANAWFALAALAGLGVLAAQRRGFLLAAIAACGSMAFVDFSTSGLENALAHALLVAFASVLATGGPGAGRALALCALAGLLALNRLDHALLAAPGLAWALARTPAREALRASAGFLPLIAWFAFALVYYGTPWPNTAYAKLGSGIPAADLREQGLAYLANSLAWDPLTLATIALGCAVGLATPAGRALALGAALYVAYVVQVGGDHMAGRFLTAPLALGLAQLALARWRPLPWALAALLLGGLASVARTPPLLSPPDLSKRDLDPYGIADERGFFYRHSGLLRPPGPLPRSETPHLRDGRAAAEQGKQVVEWGMVGWFGYGAGPGVHVIDPLGLTDPLLARLPRRAGPWRVGHYTRDIPAGYAEAAVGRGRIADSQLAAWAEDLHRVTRGPLFAPERWAAAWRLVAVGDAPLQAYCRRRCSILPAAFLREAKTRVDPRPFEVPAHGVAVAVDRPDRLTLRVTPGTWEIELRDGNAVVDRREVEVPATGAALTRASVDLPPVPAATTVRVFGPASGRLSTLSVRARR